MHMAFRAFLGSLKREAPPKKEEAGRVVDVGAGAGMGPAVQAEAVGGAGGAKAFS
jgi:hypothetical protein